LRRGWNRLRFELGQFLLRGTGFRLLVMAGLIGAVALLGGLVVHGVDPDHESLEDAIWWAFLRLTDPGYLGDDHGAARRTISTVITVIGYVLFLGALVAIMTQWLNELLRRMQSGLTPITRDGHVLVAGWTDRTVSILREMFRTEERSHVLLGGRGRRLNAVVLAEEASAVLHQELRERMAEHWREHQIVLRQGEAIRLDHLRRADFAHAATIVLPGDPYLGEENAPSDVRVMKALMSVAHHARNELGDAPLPKVVAELFDARREAVAKSLYPGQIEVVVSDRLIGRMLALNLRHPGLAHVYRELLFERTGQHMQVVPLPEPLRGQLFAEAVRRMPGSVLLGVMRGTEPLLCPGPRFELLSGDQLVVFGRDGATLDPHAGEALPREAQRHTLVPSLRPEGGVQLQSLLVLGWTRKVPAVLEELLKGVEETLRVDVISTSELSERREELGGIADHPKLAMCHERADYTVPEVLRRRDLTPYDAVLLVGSDRLESGAESDARSLIGYEVLRSCLPATGAEPRVVIEVMDAENAALIGERRAETLVSPQMLGRVLAQIALTPDLCEVYDELFGAGGAELAIHRADEYGIEGRHPVSFATLREAVARSGDVLLGVQTREGRTVSLNPPPGAEFAPAAEVRVVVAIRV
jgi:hypothetical protein